MTLTPRYTDPLSKYILYVLLGFVVIGVSLYLLSIKFGRVSLEENINLKVIQSSVRVDVVGMPKFTLKELRNMETVQTSTESVETTNTQASDDSDIVKLQDESKKEEIKPSTDFLSKIKSLSKQKKIEIKKEKKSNDETKKNTVNLNKLNDLILEGNKVSSGTAIAGKQAQEDLTLLERYLSKIPQYVKPHWKLPSYLKEKPDLRCRIRIFINSKGKIFKTDVIEASEEPEYDAMALAAISKTTLPAPSGAVLESLLKGVAVLGFPL